MAAYRMRMSDWSSDVCSCDLVELFGQRVGVVAQRSEQAFVGRLDAATDIAIGEPGENGGDIADRRLGHAEQAVDALRQPPVDAFECRRVAAAAEIAAGGRLHDARDGLFQPFRPAPPPAGPAAATTPHPRSP